MGSSMLRMFITINQTFRHMELCPRLTIYVKTAANPNYLLALGWDKKERKLKMAIIVTKIFEYSNLQVHNYQTAFRWPAMILRRSWRTVSRPEQ